MVSRLIAALLPTLANFKGAKPSQKWLGFRWDTVRKDLSYGVDSVALAWEGDQDLGRGITATINIQMLKKRC